MARGCAHAQHAFEKLGSPRPRRNRATGRFSASILPDLHPILIEYRLNDGPRVARLDAMESRFRSAAALFALIALTLSFAEGVWASTCMPSSEMTMASSMADPMQAGDDCMMNTSAPTDDPADQTPQHSTPSHCPVAPLSTAGTCVVAASLPGSSPLDLATFSEDAHLTLSLDQTRDLLLVSVLFHPPKT